MFRKSKFAIFFILSIFLLSTNLPILNATEMKNFNLVSTLSKDTEILNEFEKNEYVPLIIEMQEQVNSSEVVKKVKQQIKLNKKITPHEEKMQIRHAVVNELKTTAELSQKNLLNFLNNEREVKDVKSFYIMNVISLNTTESVYEQLLEFPGIKNIRLDRKISLDFPNISSELETNNLSLQDKIEWNLKQIGVDQVWEEFGVNGSGVVVGIIDSGVHWTHEAIMDKWRGYDPNNPDQPNPIGNWFDAVEGRTMPYDIAQNPHGTHVLGTILGQDPSGKNKIGVAPGAKWIAAKAFTLEGGMESWLIAAGQFMLAPNDDPDLAPDIINNSWGGASGLNEWYRPMVQAWRDAQIVPIFSAGNTPGGSSPRSISVPANYPESIAVAATDIQNFRGNFSNQGPGPYTDDLKPDISAPGVNIRSSVPGGYAGGWNGTSMAAPHVSGVAALLRSIDATISVDDIEQILLNTATPLIDNQYPESPNYGYGYGLINAYEAISYVAKDSGIITGTVLKRGEDEEVPTIDHIPLEFGYEGLEFVLTTDVSDQTSVTNVELLIKRKEEDEWNTIKMERISGDFKEGTYQINVPVQYVRNPGFEYKISATDFSGNNSETDIFSVEISYGIDPSTSFDYDFSEDISGLILTGDWEIGTPSVGPQPLRGEKLITTNLTGNYSNGSMSVLQLPPLDLRFVNEATITFEHWFDIEYQYDYGKLMITKDIDSGSWEELARFSGRERKWISTEIDLQDYVGSKNQVYIQFILESDEQYNHAGWYIDYINISGQKSNLPSNQIFSIVDDVEKIKTTNKSGLPLEATVTVIETGRTVKSSLEDGSYTLVHQVNEDRGTYTLKVESYGYYSEERSIALSANETIFEEFILEEIPRGQLNIKVIDSETKEPVEEAEIKIIEDHRLGYQITDSEGEVKYPDVLIGEYTVEVYKPNYYLKNVNIGISEDELTSITVELERFPGKLLAYDDGVADNARVFIDSGHGFAVQMTPENNAKIIGASIYLWGNNFPVPGGNHFSLAVYDSNDDGSPGNQLLEPIEIEGKRGEWNYINLSEYEINTNRDFYIVMFQDAIGDHSPAVGFDENSEFSGRSYTVDPNGKFEKLSSIYGNIMIRSHVIYTVDAPTLNDIENQYVNRESIKITGNITEEGLINIYNNGQKAVSLHSEAGTFSIDVPLTEGENNIYATLQTVDGQVSDPSNYLLVFKDTIAPTITDFYPDVDLYIQNGYVVNLSFISDTSDGEATLTIKDESDDTIAEIIMQEVEPYKYIASWEVGENESFKYATFQVEHVDQAGNKTIKFASGKGYLIDDIVSRVFGKNRLDTALEISKQGWDTSNVVILARSDDFADALTGTTLSYHYDAPILLTQSQKLYDGTLDEIKRLGADKVIILGGEVAISNEVEKVLREANLEIDRISGKTRIETSVLIAERLNSSLGEAIIVNGLDFPDAMSVATYAAKNSIPILLTYQHNLPEGTKTMLEKMNVEKTLVVGGTSVVSNEIINQIPEPTRISGQNRYQTNIEMLNYAQPEVSHLYVATGRDFADALTGAALAAKRDSGILLTYEKIPAYMEDFIRNSWFTSMTLIGGEGAIGKEIEQKLKELIR